MASLQYITTPGVGQTQRTNFRYSEAVRIPGTGLVKFAGQGGWDPHADTQVLDRDDVNGQVEKAFLNVEKVLHAVGLKGWEDVYLIRTYHVDAQDDSAGKVVEMLKKFCPDHCPVWTMLGVQRLGEPEMMFEIDVEAYDSSWKERR